MNFHTTISRKKWNAADIYLRKTPNKSLTSPPLLLFSENHLFVYFPDKIVVAKSTNMNVEQVCYVIS